MSYLCVPIFVSDIEDALTEVTRAAEAGAELVELRIDLKDDNWTAEAINHLIRAAVLPCIATCRPESEGGRSTLGDEARLKALFAAGEAGASYLDIELSTFKRSTRFVPNTNRVILSAHDFSGRPERLYDLVCDLNDAKADITKIVWTARTIRDNLEAFELLQQRHKPTIALCMGEAGLISRVLAKKFGAFLTFASLRDESATAPGQITIAEMKQLYRWDAIAPSTKVYGVVGSPIAHSMSPAIHNAGFDSVGHDGVYLPMLVNPGYESFKAFMESFLAFEPLDLAGLSITIPHKENALRYLKEKGAQIEELAERIGAVNTISIANQKSQTANLRGFNTDYSAILDTITAALNITRDGLKDLRIAVIGAGGTGRTAVAALARHGATVVVYNRTMQRADELANEFNSPPGKVVAARMEKLCDSCCHVFINTTPIGMHPNTDATPLGDPPPSFTPDTLVFDTIYNPAETKLLRHAKAAGAKTVGGIEMFVRQAAGQFESWTNKSAPVDIMRAVIESRLNR